MFGALVELDTTNRACGNCEYWKGFRRKSDSGLKALVDKNGQAKCVNKGGPWFDLIQFSLSSCISWYGWTELK